MGVKSLDGVILNPGDWLDPNETRRLRNTRWNWRAEWRQIKTRSTNARRRDDSRTRRKTPCPFTSTFSTASHLLSLESSLTPLSKHTKRSHSCAIYIGIQYMYITPTVTVRMAYHRYVNAKKKFSCYFFLFYEQAIGRTETSISRIIRFCTRKWICWLCKVYWRRNSRSVEKHHSWSNVQSC